MEAQAEAKPLSWESRPLAELLRLTWPVAVSMLSFSVMTLVDTLLVGHLGAAALAGVGLGGTIAFAIVCFPFGLLRAGKTLVSQAVGAGRPELVAAYRAAALWSALGLGLVTLGVGYEAAALMRRLTASADAGEAARLYLAIRNLGAPMWLLGTALRETRYGEGDARSPMAASVAANLLNIALAGLFVFVLHRGVAGAATATVIAQTSEAGILFAFGRRQGWRVGGATWRHLVELWRIGLPTGLQFVLEVGSFTLLASLISSMSEVQMAAHQIALQVCQFSFLPAFATAEAAAVLAGQSVGAHRDELVPRVARLGLGVTAAYTVTCSTVFVLGGAHIVAGFTAQAALAAVSLRLLHVAAVFQVFDGANVVARCVLRGIGDVRFAAVVGVSTAWLMTPPLTWLLGWRAGLGAFGGWLGLCGEIILGALVLWWRLQRGGWRAIAAASRAALALAPASHGAP